jgi:hypothetical protein
MGDKPVSGALLPSGINAEIEPVMVGEYTHIQSLVGGPFDCVTAKVGGNIIVGYVHDEGLLLGLEQNWFASALFSRNLVGPCVIVSGESADGEYDGDNHDLSDDFFRFLTTKFTTHVAETYNEATSATIAFELAKALGICTDEELDALVDKMAEEMNTGVKNGALQEVEALMETVQQRIQDFAKMAHDMQGAELVSEVEQFLKENS